MAERTRSPYSHNTDSIHHHLSRVGNSGITKVTGLRSTLTRWHLATTLKNLNPHFPEEVMAERTRS